MAQTNYKARSFLCEKCSVDTTKYVSLNSGQFYCEACAKETAEDDKIREHIKQTKQRWAKDGFED